MPARAFETELDDGARAGLDAGAAAHTLIFDHLRQTSFEVHLHSAVGAGGNTVATAETAVGTG